MSLAAEPLLSLAVTVTSEQRVESVLQNIVQGLASQPGVALTRIWLLPSADLCGSGQKPSRSPEQRERLCLVASAGTPVNSPGEDWSFLQGHFSRIPLNVGKRVRMLFKKGALRRQLVDLNEIIREMMLLLHNEATQYAILARTEIAAYLPQVMGDRVQLQQVLMNLMMNSIDAMKDVDGTRELRRQAKRLTPDCQGKYILKTAEL
jgi:hypothetical protein